MKAKDGLFSLRDWNIIWVCQIHKFCAAAPKLLKAYSENQGDYVEWLFVGSFLYKCREHLFLHINYEQTLYSFYVDFLGSLFFWATLYEKKWLKLLAKWCVVCLKYFTLTRKSNDGIRFEVHSAKIKWIGLWLRNKLLFSSTLPSVWYETGINS